MAQKVTQTLVDDIDGTEAVETVSLSLDGVDYVIDLSDVNVQRLRSSLAPFVKAARRTGRRRNAGRVGNTGHGRAETKAVREWAREKGYTLSARGRIPVDILAEFREATR